MNDDTTTHEGTGDRRAELVNAFLDGDLTADERLLATSDPELMAAVEQATHVRRLVAEVPVAPLGARDRAVTAALAAWSAASIDDVGDRPAPVVPLLRRWQPRLLAGAAAVVVVVGIGLAVTRGGSSDEQVSGEASTLAAASTTVGGGPTSRSGNPGDILTAMTGPASAGGAPPAPEAADTAEPPAIDSRDALVEFADRSSAAPGVDDAAGKSMVTCPFADAVFLGPVRYEGRAALVVRRADGTIDAIDAASCDLLESVTP